MRMLPLLVVLPLLAAPALAQTASAPPATVASTVQPATSKPAASAPTPANSHRRVGWEQRFSEANASHDGHLTLDQAKGGYVTIARHFKTIDTEHKGYVTLEDIRAWHKSQRDSRHRNATRSAPSVQPRPAMHHTMVERPAVPSGPPPAPPKGLLSQNPS